MWYGDKKIAKDMQKEQLEKRFEFGLIQLDIGNSSLYGNGFKHKELIKKKEPQWPHFIRMFAEASFEYINMQMCKL